jgi:hypothetical protein
MKRSVGAHHHAAEQDKRQQHDAAPDQWPPVVRRRNGCPRDRRRNSGVPYQPGFPTHHRPGRHQPFSAHARQQRQRIQIAIVRRQPHAEVKMRLAHRPPPRGTNLTNLVAHPNARTPCNGDPAEVQIAHCVAPVAHRHHIARRAQRTRIRDPPCPRGHDRRPDAGGDVDPAMHPGRVRARVVVLVQGQQRPAHRPLPLTRCSCRRSDQQQSSNHRDRRATHHGRRR